MTKVNATHDQARKLDIAHAATQGLDVSDVPPELRCTYPSKFCGNARAPKIDGELHRFCEFHRRRANVNQKRWTSVRRRLARESREHQKRQDALKLLGVPWGFHPHMGGSLFDPGALSPTSGENFYSYGYTPNPFSAMALSSPTMLPCEQVAPKQSTVSSTPLNDTDIHILRTLLAPSTESSTHNLVGAITPFEGPSNPLPAPLSMNSSQPLETSVTVMGAEPHEPTAYIF